METLSREKDVSKLSLFRINKFNYFNIKLTKIERSPKWSVKA